MVAKMIMITIGYINFDKFIIVGIWTMCLLLAAESQANERLEEIKIRQALSAGLLHFLDLADPEKTVAFDPEKVAGVLDFINQPGKNDALYYADSILGTPSAYYEFDIHENLKKIVAYSFNPDIPDIATVPSSVRLLYWLDAGKNRQSPPRIGRYRDRLDSPVVINGLQHMEITPDTHSGAYYAYNLHQTVLLFKYRQRNILVTVSRQVDVSTVGKKGYVLGADDDWDYLYSDILQNRYDGGKGHAKKLPSFLFKNKNHWAQMSKDEMESALVIEYMKYAVGKTRPDEVSALLGLKR